MPGQGWREKRDSRERATTLWGRKPGDGAGTFRHTGVCGIGAYTREWTWSMTGGGVRWSMTLGGGRGGRRGGSGWGWKGRKGWRWTGEGTWCCERGKGSYAGGGRRLTRSVEGSGGGSRRDMWSRGRRRSGLS